jgi:hypothetical protein
VVCGVAQYGEEVVQLFGDDKAQLLRRGKGSSSSIGKSGESIGSMRRGRGSTSSEMKGANFKFDKYGEGGAQLPVQVGVVMEIRQNVETKGLNFFREDGLNLLGLNGPNFQCG